MRAAAGYAIERLAWISDNYNRDSTVVRNVFAKRHALGFLVGLEPFGAYRKVHPNIPIYRGLGKVDFVLSKKPCALRVLGKFDVDSDVFLAHVEASVDAAEQIVYRSRQHVLAKVPLHVDESSAPIDG